MHFYTREKKFEKIEEEKQAISEPQSVAVANDVKWEP